MGLVLAFNKANAQPSFSVGAAITGTVEAGQELTCTYTVVRARPSNVTVRWYSYADNLGTDQVLIATAATYTLTGTEVGRYIRAIVTATNPAGTVQSTSAYTAAVATSEPPEPPTIATAATITGTADVGETLTVTYDFNNESSVAIQWYSYATEPTGSPLAGTDEVELGTASTQALTESEAGRWIVAVVTATNAAGSAVTSDSVAMAGVDPYEPIAPAQYVVPAYDDSELEAVYCNSGDDLQAKLNALLPGQKLVLEAGATWTGNYIIPATNLDGSDWAYIVSSAVASLPAEGSRVSASDTANMPKVQTGTYVDGSGNTQSYNSINDNNTLKILRGVSKLRLVGINITTAYEAHNNAEYALVTVGSYGSGSIGSEVVFDRCLVHGTVSGKNRDGIVMGGGTTHIAIIGCDIDYFKGVGTEAHGVHIFLTPGPVLLHNNRIVACGINVFICANSNPSGTTRTSIPADITITKNLIEKRTEWDPADPSYVGVKYMCKNLMESKGSKRVLVRGNVFKNAWLESQSGQVFFFQNEGGDGVWDVDFRDNVAYSFGVAFNFANPFDYGRGFGWQRVRVSNNLFALPRVSTLTLLVSGVGSGFGRYFTFEHNTYVTNVEPKSLLFFNNTDAQGPSGIEHWKFQNNIMRMGKNQVGVAGNPITGGSTGGYACAQTHLTDFDFNTNVAVGSSGSQFNTTYADWRNWSSGSTGGIWGNANVGFVNTSFASLGHFALDESSQFKNAATDGTDIGCDIAAIESQINSYDNPFA